VARGRREPRGRHNDKNNVPQGGGNDGASGNAALNPALFEEAASQKILGNVYSGEDGGDAAADALVKTSPCDIELRFLARLQAHGSGRFGSRLSQEIQCPADLAQRQVPFVKSSRARLGWRGEAETTKKTQLKRTGLKTRHYKKLSISKSRTREHLNREHLNIDETLRAGVYSAELFCRR